MPIPLEAMLRSAWVGLPEPFRTTNARFLEEEHLARLASRLLQFHEQGVPEELPRPHFAAECTPPLGESFAVFREALALSQRSGDEQTAVVAQAFSRALEAAGTAHLLLLLGQRLTPASLTDARAIPPTRAQLLTSSFREHNPADHLTVAARALTKHHHRSPDAFWGEVRGSTAEKNAAARKVLEHILDHTTWWNVFGHFAHEVVYEARVPTGHGARWGHGGDEFIGFLEPFDEEKCPSQASSEPEE
jgi:hypothetical protein